MKKTCTQTLYRQELKGKILQTAMEEFTQKGVRAVKMDDIRIKRIYYWKVCAFTIKRVLPICIFLVFNPNTM